MTDVSSTSVRFETNTWTGSGAGRFNEDYACIDDSSSCVVLTDGATGLTKVNLVQGESDAAWYARTLSETALGQLVSEDKGLIDALEAAGASAAASYRTFPGAMELEHIDEPNGSMCVMRWMGGVVELGTLGDCTTAVGMRDGSVHIIYDDTLSKLDDENYERMYAYAIEHDTTMAVARRALNPCFIENRLKMNEPGGYWAADLTCRGFAHTQAYSFPMGDVAWLFACTDGFENAVKMGVVSSAEELAKRVAAGEGESLGNALREAEELDALCWRVHRSKTSDDATYVFVEFS